MFLDLEIPDDDPLRPAKMLVNDAAPGFRIYDKDDGIGWESDYIWLVAINEEDGLDCKVRQTIDGEREIQALWKEHELDSTAKLRDLLREDVQWDVYQLRAVVLLQNRVEAQLHTLQEFGEPPRDASIKEGPWKLAERLRSLESAMLVRARAELEDQVSPSIGLRMIVPSQGDKCTLANCLQEAKLLESKVVQGYLGLGNGDDEEEDFS